MLRLRALRNVTRLLFEKPLATYETSQPRNIVFSWEGNKEHADKYEKTPYTRPMKKKDKIKQERKEFAKLKKLITEKIERDLNKNVKEVVEEVDDAFRPEENPPVRKYDRVVAKELYFIPRVDNLYQYNNRKNAYLTQFLEPYEILDNKASQILNSCEKRLTEILKAPITSFQDPDFSPTEFQKGDQQFTDLLFQLRDLIPNINARFYPNIALFLGCKLRYKEDFAGVWAVLEDAIFKILHNYTPIEIAKLRFGMAGAYPKAGSANLHKAFMDMAIEDLKTMNTSDFLHTFHAFRLMNTLKFYEKAIEQILSKGILFVRNDPEAVANLLYTYANCKKKNYQRKVYRDPEEDSIETLKILDYLLPELEEAIPQMSLEGLVRVCLALTILRVRDYGDIILKLERTIKKKANELDAFQTANFIYAFSKMNDGQGAGKLDFYTEMEKCVFKHKDQFNDLELSRIFYAYTNKGLLSKDMKDKIFLPWIQKNIETFNYAELANVAYGLMFIQNEDKELWRKFARNVSTQKHRVPLVLYAPFKIARYYMDMLFPKWELALYEDTCFEAERYYSIARREKDYDTIEYETISRILKFELNDNTIRIWVEWENLFFIDYALPSHRFAMIVKKPSDCLHNGEPKPMFALKKRILEEGGWNLLIIDWNKFVDLGPEVRVNWLKEEIAKGVEKCKQAAQEIEDERRYAVLKNMKLFGERYESQGEKATEKIIEELSNKM